MARFPIPPHVKEDWTLPQGSLECGVIWKLCVRFRTECGIVGIVLDAKLRLVTWFLLKSLEGRKREGGCWKETETDREGRNTSRHSQTHFQKPKPWLKKKSYTLFIYHALSYGLACLCDTKTLCWRSWNVHTSVYELKMDRKPYSPTSQSESVRTSSYGSHLGQESKIGIISDVHIQIHTYRLSTNPTGTGNEWITGITIFCGWIACVCMRMHKSVCSRESARIDE